MQMIGIIREAVIIKVFVSINIISIDLSPQLKLDSRLARWLLKLQGSQVAIEGINPRSLRLIIDLGYVTEPGTLVLYPKPDIPPGFVVLKYQPRELRLTFLPLEEAGEEPIEENDE